MTLRVEALIATSLAAAVATGCATAPSTTTYPTAPTHSPQIAQRPSQPAPAAPQSGAPGEPQAQPAAEPFQLYVARYEDLPGWTSADLAPALQAFRRQCEAWSRQTPNASLSGGRYGGRVADWLPACGAAATVTAGQERTFFETWFYPAAVAGAGEAKLTAYFEPVIEVRRTPEGRFVEPLLRRPSDMLTVDLAAFADAYDSQALRGAPRALTGRLEGNRVAPYPKREAIQPQPNQVIAYAHPADVYNLQVQGSGRIRFPDGVETRAQFAAQNGYKWSSAMGALRSAGKLAAATWNGFRNFMDTHPQEVRQALNADPSYVFFQEETVPDPVAGPRGAAGVPLTPLGSIAVDPAYHPYGALIFVSGSYEGGAFQRLLQAQDTGGAIRRGPLRGDVFFGSGPVAGDGAERMNAPAQWWTLLPRPAETPVAGSAGGPARG